MAVQYGPDGALQRLLVDRGPDPGGHHEVVGHGVRRDHLHEPQRGLAVRDRGEGEAEAVGAQLLQGGRVGGLQQAAGVEFLHQLLGVEFGQLVEEGRLGGRCRCRGRGRCRGRREYGRCGGGGRCGRAADDPDEVGDHLGDRAAVQEDHRRHTVPEQRLHPVDQADRQHRVEAEVPQSGVRVEPGHRHAQRVGQLGQDDLVHRSGHGGGCRCRFDRGCC